MSNETTMTTLEEVAARLEIRDAIDKNCVMYDDGRWADAYSMFADDAELVLPPPQPTVVGRAAMLARFDHRVPGDVGPYGYVRHCITTHHVVSLSATRARAVSYYFVFIGGPIGAAGRYDDDFVCVDGTWLIRTRRVLTDLSLFPPSEKK